MRANWWLRDVVSATNFANVNNNGNANYNNASNGNGIRPDFGSARQVLPIGKALHRKERLSVPQGEKTAPEGGAAACRFALCGKIRRADSRGLILRRRHATFLWD